MSSKTFPIVTLGLSNLSVSSMGIAALPEVMR